MESAVNEAVAFGPGIDEVAAPAPKPRSARPKPSTAPVVDEPALPKAIVMTAVCQLDLILGNSMSFRENQRVTDPQIIGLVIARKLPYRVAD